VVKNKEKHKTKGLSLPASLMAKMIKIAEERRQPFSWVVRDAIEYYLTICVGEEKNEVRGERIDE